MGYERNLLRFGLSPSTSVTKQTRSLRYGFCAATLVLDEPVRGVPDRCSGCDPGGSAALLGWIKASSDILGSATTRRVRPAGILTWQRAWVVIASIGDDAVTRPCSMFARQSVVMTYRAKREMTRSASVTTLRRCAQRRRSRGRRSDRNGDAAQGQKYRLVRQAQTYCRGEAGGSSRAACPR